MSKSKKPSKPTVSTKKPRFTRDPVAAPPDALDDAVNSAIATVQADIAKAGKGNLTSDPAVPKKQAKKAPKAAKAAPQPAPAPEVPDAAEVLLATDAQIAALPPPSVHPHLDPESGLWIPKNPNHGKPKEPKPPKVKEPKPPKPLKPVTGQPSRGANSTTAVVSMKVPLKAALAKASTTNLRSLSAQAALYILEGLKRDGFLAAEAPEVVETPETPAADAATE